MALSTPPPPSETSNAAPRRPPPKVLVEEKSCGRIFMLNRPKQLNALSGLMVSCLLELFLACAQDSSVKLIILKGKGRAFCAGGDVVVVVRDITQGKWKSGADYFRKLYTLNYIIATYGKPQEFSWQGMNEARDGVNGIDK